MFKGNILLFAGTTEGRLIAEFLEENKIPADVSVASEYGKEIIGTFSCLNILSGRLDKNDIKNLILKNSYSLVVDATHPFAVKVTENIKEACDETDTEYIRVLREQTRTDDAVTADSFSQAVDIINSTDVNVLLTTGSKELSEFKNVKNLSERIFVRTLPTAEAIEKCREIGIKSSNIICMQGPFSVELNCAMLNQLNCKMMVTKASGDAGGMLQKAEAAKKCGAKLVVITPPKDEKGISLEEIKERLKNRYGK